MTESTGDSYPVRLQSAVYSTAFFNGMVQSMASTIVALLVVALIDKNLGFVIGMLISARDWRPIWQIPTWFAGAVLLLFVMLFRYRDKPEESSLDDHS